MEAVAIILSNPTVQNILSALIVALVCLKILESIGLPLLNKQTVFALCSPFIKVFSMLSFLFSWIPAWNSKKPPSLYGDSAWMKKKDLKKFLNNKNKGWVLDGATAKMRMSKLDSFKPVLVTAPAGASKSTGFVIPNIINLLDDRNVIIATDPAGEIYNATSSYAKEKGYDIKVLKPDDLQNSLLFNPLSYIDKNGKKFDGDIAKVAHILATANSTGRGEKIWETGTAEALELAIYALFQQPEQYRNLGQIRHLLNNFGVSGDAWLNMLMSCNTSVQSAWSGFTANDSKMMASFLSGAKSSLKPFTNPDLIKLTSSDTCDIQDIRKRKAIWYIILPETEVSFYGWMLQLFYTTVFSQLTRTLPSKEDLDVFILLDEFGNSGKLLSGDGGSGGIDTMLTTLRKRRVAISALVQTERSQIHAIYGRDAGNTIVEAFQHKLYLSGGHSEETCESLSKRLGNYTVTERDPKGKRVVRQSARRLLTPDEVRTRPSNSAILLSTDQAPVEIKAGQRFFESKSMMKKIKKPVVLDYPATTDEVEFLPLIEEQNGRGEIELAFAMMGDDGKISKDFHANGHDSAPDLDCASDSEAD